MRHHGDTESTEVLNATSQRRYAISR